MRIKDIDERKIILLEAFMMNDHDDLYDMHKTKIIASLSISDEDKWKYYYMSIEKHDNPEYKTIIAENLKSDEDKLRFLEELKTSTKKVESMEYDYYIARIIASLSSDDEKLKLLATVKNPDNQLKIVISLQSDDNKLKILDSEIYEDIKPEGIICSLKSVNEKYAHYYNIFDVNSRISVLFEYAKGLSSDDDRERLRESVDKFYEKLAVTMAFTSDDKKLEFLKAKELQLDVPKEEREKIIKAYIDYLYDFEVKRKLEHVHIATLENQEKMRMFFEQIYNSVKGYVQFYAKQIYQDDMTKSKYKAKLIASLKSDAKKLDLLDTVEFEFRYAIVISLQSDEEKLNQLKNVYLDSSTMYTLYLIIQSLSSLEKILEAFDIVWNKFLAYYKEIDDVVIENDNTIGIMIDIITYAGNFYLKNANEVETYTIDSMLENVSNKIKELFPETVLVKQVSTNSQAKKQKNKPLGQITKMQEKVSQTSEIKSNSENNFSKTFKSHNIQTPIQRENNDVPDHPVFSKNNVNDGVKRLQIFGVILAKQKGKRALVNAINKMGATVERQTQLAKIDEELKILYAGMDQADNHSKVINNLIKEHEKTIKDSLSRRRKK